MNDPQALAAFENCGVILRGSHLVYTSGRHGSDYVNKDALYPHTEVVSDLCSRIARQFANQGIEVVLAPALGGIILSQWTAHHLQEQTKRPVLSVYAEKAEDGFVLRRGYDALVKAKRVLIVEDVLTTGGSVAKVVELARATGAEVVSVAALCNRGGVTDATLNCPLFSLTELVLESWDPKECPLCERGVPIHRSLGKGKSL